MTGPAAPTRERPPNEPPVPRTGGSWPCSPRRNGDLALAEDALGEAFERALRSWPGTGVPRNPEGWLLTVARNRQRDVWKSPAHRRTTPLDDLAEDWRDPWPRTTTSASSIPTPCPTGVSS